MSLYREVLITLHKELMEQRDRKSTRLNSSHVSISYAVFCLKKKNELVRTELAWGRAMIPAKIPHRNAELTTMCIAFLSKINPTVANSATPSNTQEAQIERAP